MNSVVYVTWLYLHGFWCMHGKHCFSHSIEESRFNKVKYSWKCVFNGIPVTSLHEHVCVRHHVSNFAFLILWQHSLVVGIIIVTRKWRNQSRGRLVNSAKVLQWAGGRVWVTKHISSSWLECSLPNLIASLPHSPTRLLPGLGLFILCLEVGKIFFPHISFLLSLLQDPKIQSLLGNFLEQTRSKHFGLLFLPSGMPFLFFSAWSAPVHFPKSWWTPVCLSKSNSYVMSTVKPPLTAVDSYSLQLSSHDTLYLYHNKRNIFYGFDRCPCKIVISPRKGPYFFHVFVSTMVLRKVICSKSLNWLNTGAWLQRGKEIVSHEISWWGPETSCSSSLLSLLPSRVLEPSLKWSIRWQWRPRKMKHPVETSRMGYERTELPKGRGRGKRGVFYASIICNSETV